MPTIPKHIDLTIKRQRSFETDRSLWESQWQDAKELIRPNTSDFNRTGVKGERKFEKVYDATAIDANEEFAGGLAGYATSATDRWFSLRMKNRSLENSLRLRTWLDRTSDLIYDAYSSPSSNFNPSYHEGYLDIGAFGWFVIYQYWHAKSRAVRFKTIPIADCWIDENHEGHVDTLFRKIKMSARQIEQRFGQLPPQIRKENKLDKLYSVLHAVFPRVDRNPRKLTGVNKPFASLWISLDTKEELYEGGFDIFPYIVPRWTKLSGEVYGRGPGMKVLPDVKVLNRYEQYMLKAGAKTVDPPLTVPNDGFLLPVNTSPGALNYKENNADGIEPLIPPGAYNLPFGLDQMERKKASIERGYYLTLFRMEKENVEMTAFETADRREEKLRLLGPQLGRLESEALGPTISQTFYLLDRAGQIPPIPLEGSEQELMIEYTSPAAKAQTGVRAFAMERYVQRLIPLAQMKPDVLDVVNTDAYAQELASTMGTPAMIINSPDQIQAIREQRAQAEQQQALMGAAEPASKAIKNIADAQRS